MRCPSVLYIRTLLMLNPLSLSKVKWYVHCRLNTGPINIKEPITAATIMMEPMIVKRMIKAHDQIILQSDFMHTLMKHGASR